MKIILEGKFSENSRNLVRRCGYGEFINPRTGEQSFTRKLGGGIYPQFHLYINEESDRGIVLNLHLDQKKPTYAGSHAHSGEYDGELVENEAKRIKEIILGNIIG
jgi:hypothetical protein